VFCCGKTSRGCLRERERAEHKPHPRFVLELLTIGVSKKEVNFNLVLY